MNEQDAILGKIIRQFTDSENILREIGAMIDKCIITEEDTAFRNIVSEMYLKLCSLQISINDYSECIRNYIAPTETTTEGDVQ